MEHPIYEKIETSSTVDFGSVLSRSYDLFLKIWRQGAMHTLITFIGIIPFLIITYAPIIYLSAQANSYSRNYYYDDYYSNDLPFSEGNLILFYLVYFVVMFVMIMLLQVLQFGIGAHFYKVCRIVDHGTDENQEGYFEFFKNGNIKKLFVLALATTGISIVALLLCVLPLFYVMVPLQLMLPIFTFNKKLSVSEIIKVAFKLGNKHWIYVFGFAIIASNVAQLGAFACLVGIIFTACIVYLPIYFFYKDTIGFNENTTDDQLLIQRE